MFYLYSLRELGRPHILSTYKTQKGAKISLAAANRNAGHDAYAIISEEEYNEKFTGTGTFISKRTQK